MARPTVLGVRHQGHTARAGSPSAAAIEASALRYVAAVRLIVELLGQPESLFEYVGTVVAVAPEPAVEAYAQ